MQTSDECGIVSGAISHRQLLDLLLPIPGTSVLDAASFTGHTFAFRISVLIGSPSDAAVRLPIHNLS